MGSFSIATSLSTIPAKSIWLASPVPSPLTATLVVTWSSLARAPCHLLDGEPPPGHLTGGRLGHFTCGLATRAA